MTVTVKVEMGRLQHLMGSTDGAADRIVEASARRIEGGFKTRAIVGKTGMHRASCVVTNIGKARRRIGPTMRYSPFVEQGTRHMAARPALLPAFDAEVPNLKEQLRGVVD